MKKFVLLLLFIGASAYSYSQTDSCINYFTGHKVYAIAEGKDDIWVATECKIVRLNKLTRNLSFITHRPQIKCFSYQYFTLMVDSLDNLWLGGGDGVWKFDGNNWISVAPHVPNYSIRLLEADNQGNIWYVSKGLSNSVLKKYDGTDFTDIPVPYGVVEIAFDTNNAIWMITNNGLVRLKDSVFTEYNEVNSPLPGSEFSSITINSKGIWVSGTVTDTNFYNPRKYFIANYNGSQWFVYPDSTIDVGVIESLKTDKSDKVWVLGHKGIAKYNGNFWQIAVGVGANIDAERLNLLFIDEADNKWIGTFNEGAFVYDDSLVSKVILGNSDLPGQYVKALGMDGEGMLWIGAEGSKYGFGQFDGTNWINYNNCSSESPCIADAFVQDHQGNMWVANQRYLYRYDGIEWKKFPADLDGAYISLAVDSANHIWATSFSRDLKEFDGSKWIEHNGYPGWSSSSKAVTVDSDNNVWLGISDHLVKYDGYQWTSYECETQPGHDCFGGIQALQFDLNNDLWIGSNRELTRFDGEKYHIYKKMPGPVYPNIYVHAIAVDDSNNVWVGTFSDGLLKFNGKVWRQFVTANSEIIGNTIYSIVIRNGEIWLGSENGLINFKECGGDTIEFAYNIISGLREVGRQEISLVVSPNPITETANIKYNLTSPSPLEFRLYDSNGRIVKEINERSGLPEGNLVLNTADLKSGVYIGVLRTKNGIGHCKLIKLF